MRDHILDEARAQLEATEAENARLAGVLHIGLTLAGESHCLRTIIYAVIQEMVQRLAPG